MSEAGNGNGTNQLPPKREAIVDMGNRLHQEVCNERDELRDEVAFLKVELAARDKQLETLQSLMNMMESRVISATEARDEAIRKHAELQGLFIGFKAQMLAFQIPAAPLVREVTDETEGAGDEIKGTA